MKKLKLLNIMFFLVVTISFVSAHMGFNYYDYGWGWGMMLFMWLFGILILVALILFIVWLVRQIKKN